MRLLNVDSLDLEEFYSEPPKYATLSHTWGAPKDEVSFRALQDVAPKIRELIGIGLGKGQVDGASKIAGCCIQAKKAEFNIMYVWIDTCCIDKTSSAEETESINSMFNWYAGSDVCFVHLADVNATLSDNDIHDQVQHSKWFLRGWTLQELLAPRKLMFFNRNWCAIGDHRTLAQDIHIATKISGEHMANFSTASVATKMSWASRRRTSRIEDRAYSLLGIFGLSMYTQYGERDKAFQRLQRTLIENSRDESIFAWTSAEPSSGLLAPSPDCFLSSADIISSYKKNKPRPPHRIVMNTLELWVPAGYFEQDASILSLKMKRKKNLDVTLNCWRPTSSGMRAIKILFGKDNGNWRRINCKELDYSDSVPGPNLWYRNPSKALYLDL